MSISSPSLSSAAPIVNAASEPASIRNGDKTAKNAYAEGAAFEQMLLNQLTQTMSDTIGASGSSSDGLGGSTDSSGSSDGSGSPLGAYSSMLPSALTSGVMQNGGTGVAMQIAQALDPALLSAASTPSTGATSGHSGGVGLTTGPAAAGSPATGTAATGTTAQSGGVGLTEPRTTAALTGTTAQSGGVGLTTTTGGTV